MPVTPKETIDFVNSLAVTDEASIRAAISRAYYAVYYAVDNFHKNLPEKGFTAPSDRGTHHILYIQLVNPGIPRDDNFYNASKSIGYKLREMHELRVKADYCIKEIIRKEEAVRLVEASKKLIDKIEALLPYKIS